jgi:hypothetical protein
MMMLRFRQQNRVDGDGSWWWFFVAFFVIFFVHSTGILHRSGTKHEILVQKSRESLLEKNLSIVISFVVLDKLYPPLVLSAWTTFCEVTHPPTLFESPWDKYTIFVSCIHPWAEALGRILKTKWCICPRSIQKGRYT